MALKRIAKEYKDLTTNPPRDLVEVKLVNDNLYEWEVVINGPVSFVNRKLVFITHRRHKGGFTLSGRNF